MINEQLLLRLDALTARLRVIEDEVKHLKALRAAQDTHADHAHEATGTQGTLTIATAETETITVLDGYITPTGDPVNVRSETRVAPKTFVYKLQPGESRAVAASMTVGDFLWFKLMDGNYARGDVVTFSKEKPATQPLMTNVTWGRWDAPIDHYDTTNIHGVHNHNGVDLAAPTGTPVHCGPHGGFVVKAFACKPCQEYGDGRASLTKPDFGFGFGRHAIVYYPKDDLPESAKAEMTDGDTGVLVMYAHLSVLRVTEGQQLKPFEQIGEVGATGNTYSINGGSPSHLHLQCRLSTRFPGNWNLSAPREIDPGTIFQIIGGHR